MPYPTPPRARHSGPPEPRHTEPRHTEPRHTEPRHTEPRHTEPRHTELRQAEPRHTEPRQAEPRHTEPRHTEAAQERYDGPPESRSGGWPERRPGSTGRYAVVPSGSPQRPHSARDTELLSRWQAEEEQEMPPRQAREEIRRAPRPKPPAPDALLSDAVVRAVDLVKVHGRGARAVHALDGVTLSVERGRFTAIMGPSGSGKSTLMHCLAGLDTPTSGHVVLGLTDLSRLSERKLTRLRRDRVGVVFQSYNLLPQLTVRQNIVLPLEVAGSKLDRRWLDTVIDVLDLGPLLPQRPAQLSGGQQQRVAMARALLPRPEVVFADEPTGALDAGTAREMLQFLRTSVQDLGQTVVMVTHDPLAAQHTDRVLMLYGGRLAGQLLDPTAHGVLDVLAMLDDEAMAEVPHQRGPDTGHGADAGYARARQPAYPA